MDFRPENSTRTASVVAVALATTIGATTLLSGCGSSTPRRSPSPESQIADLGQRRTEALRLISEAQRLETTDPERAAQLYRESVSLDSGLHSAWNNLGLLMLNNGQYADAVSAFQAASDLQPTDPRPEYNIGLAYQKNGWGDLALRHFTNALERDDTHLPSMRGFIRAAEMTGKADTETHEVVKRAILRETNAAWRAYFQRQRYRIEAVMEQR